MKLFNRLCEIWPVFAAAVFLLFAALLPGQTPTTQPVRENFDPPLRGLEVEARDYIERVRLATGKRFDASRIEAELATPTSQPVKRGYIPPTLEQRIRSLEDRVAELESQLRHEHRRIGRQ